MRPLLLFKRGDTQEHLLSIIIGVVALGLLVFVLFRMWDAARRAEYDNAAVSLRVAEQKLKSINAGESTRFPLQGPQGWFVQGWSVSDAGRPEKCYFESCICICKEGGKRGAASCSDPSAGICFLVEQRQVEVFSEVFTLEQGSFGGENPSAWKRSAQRTRCMSIWLGGALTEVHVRKSAEKIEMEHVSDEMLDASQLEARCRR